VGVGAVAPLPVVGVQDGGLLSAAPALINMGPGPALGAGGRPNRSAAAAGAAHGAASTRCAEPAKSGTGLQTIGTAGVCSKVVLAEYAGTWSHVAMPSDRIWQADSCWLTPVAPAAN
jgi:hypothetical protein